ncbi:AAA family ATPase [Microcoleus sp. herbarium19]|uniref:McrB family protein n=1 Tax=unclassified Microcoleus TaxID=2642155 RepID=UPI002FD1A9DE
MNNANVITWSQIEDRMKSMIGKFLDYSEVFERFIPEYTWGSIDEYTEELTRFRVLEWLKNAWKALIKSGVVNYCTQVEYFQALLYCVSLFYLYVEYSGLSMVGYDLFLDVADFMGIHICNFKQIIDEDYRNQTTADKNCEYGFDREIFNLIDNVLQDLVGILIENFGSRLRLSDSIQKSIESMQLDYDLYENDDTFDQAETEAINELIKIDMITEKWEEIEGDEVRKAALTLVHYFQGEMIDIEEEIKPMINQDHQDFQTNRFRNMKYDTISPKYLFSQSTFEWITKWEDKTKSSLFPTYINYAKLVEYVEEPFNRLCYLVSAKLPSQLSALPGDAKWNEAELEKEFGYFKLCYIRLNRNYITFGYSKEIYRSIFLNVLQTKPDELQEVIIKNQKKHDILDVSNTECFITKNELINLSTSQLSHQIAQFFINHIDLILLATLDAQKTAINDPLYSLVNESKLNPKYTLSNCAEEAGLNETELKIWIQAIHRKKQAILQGPPGTGKTFIAEKLAKHLIGCGDGFSDIIQFHPAYTYEDFIQGIRPQSQNDQLTYPIVPGRFIGFCTKAESCQDTCVLIIDEINRANLSQVFGELMYLLDDRDRTVKLASGQLFRIPKNVRIIGTMNTADRSIALVDNALRRRFAFIPIYPNYEVLRQYHQREKTGFPVGNLTKILENVNRAINNKHYELGISFFLTKTLAEDIQDIWQMEIEPYLEEYFFDNQAKMDEFIWNKIKDQLSK